MTDSLLLLRRLIECGNENIFEHMYRFGCILRATHVVKQSVVEFVIVNKLAKHAQTKKRVQAHEANTK